MTPNGPSSDPSGIRRPLAMVFFAIVHILLICLPMETTRAWAQMHDNETPLKQNGREVDVEARFGGGTSDTCSPKAQGIELHEFGPCWDDVVKSAADQWYRTDARVRINIKSSSAESGCIVGDGISTVTAGDNYCGREFGERTLGVAVNRYDKESGFILENDVVFNTAFSWNSYSGPRRSVSDEVPLIDMHRVAIHEFGHIWGLDHPDEAEPAQEVAAIMNSTSGDIDRLQQDDIDGIVAIYGTADPPGPPVNSSGNIELDDTGTLAIDEGSTGTFTVKLDTAPNDDVTVTITSADTDAVSVSPASLTFTTSNYSTAQTITVTGVVDTDTDDESVVLTISATGGIIADDVTKTVRVDDAQAPSAIVVSDAADALSIDEGGSGTFTVRIHPASTPSVSVTLTSSDSDITVSPTTLTFAAGATATQTVTVSAAHDSDNRNESATITLSTESIDTDDVAKRIAVKDDETPSGDIVLDNDARLDLGEGGGGTFTVRLDTTPNADVTITIMSADAGAVSVVPASLTFTAANHSTAQTVRVTAPHDIDIEDESVDITLSASGGIVASDVKKSVAVDDDDEAGSLVMLPSPLHVIEGGQERLFVRLGTAPTVARVVVSLANTNTALTLNPTTLTFTDDNWNADQTVTVAVEGGGNADNGSDTITGTFENGTGNYAATANPQGATVSVITLDRPGDILASKTMVDLVEGGEPVELTVRLGEVPIGTDTVTVTLSNSNPDVDVSPDVLIYTRNNWSEERIVSLQAGEDSDRQEDYDFIVLSGAGGNYSRSRTVIAVSVEENEDGGVIGGTPGRSGVYALAIPPETGPDSSDIRIRCKQSSPCAVYFDCTAQEDGDAIEGWLPELIPAWGTRTVGASDIVRHTGDSWFGKGRLGCLLRSKERIGAQVWTRSGDGVLVNNSALLESALDARHGNRRVDIESIPSPDGDEQTNLRIRCLAPESEHCTRTAFTCFADDGMRHEGALGRIDRLTVRHLQTGELASLIDHRWEGMGLSCELRSDNHFTVQVMTRTGGGGALVNNSATGTLGN